MILRTIPFNCSKIGMKYVYNMAAGANTATITNLGNIRLHRNINYVDHFSVIFVTFQRTESEDVPLFL